MNPHSEPHVHVHIEIEKTSFDALRKLHTRYGERSRVIRQLLTDYLAETDSLDGEAAARGDA